MKQLLNSQEETEQIGAKLYQQLPKKYTVFLYGNLGAGKTTLVRGFLRAAGHQGAVKSPTYTVVEEYDINGQKIFHFDLYRLNDPEELEWIGIRDYFEQDAICFIEWPDMGKGFLPVADMTIELTMKQKAREISIVSEGHQLNTGH